MRHYYEPIQQLCDYKSGYGALQCNNKSGGCPGSNNGNCYPNIVWSGEEVPSQSGYYYHGNLNSGTFYATTSNYNIYTNARGVRCVLGFETNNNARKSFGHF